MSARGSRLALRILFRFGIFYAAVFVLWLPLRETYVRLLAGGAARVLALLEHPPLVTSLVPHGSSITLHSCITGQPQPLATWNGDMIHIFVVVSLALVLAIPRPTWQAHLRTLALSSLFVFGVTLGLCVVHLKMMAESFAASTLGITLHTVREKLVLEWAERGLLMVGMLLLPALLFLTSYVASWPARADESDAPLPNPAPVRWRTTAISIVCGAAFVAFLSMPRADSGVEGCRTALGRILELNPSSAYAHFGLGLNHEKSGELQEAHRLYNLALSLDPNLVVARFGMGNVLFKQGQFDEAAHWYEKTLESDPGHVSARFNLGNALHELGRNERAVEAYLEVLRTNPREASAHKNLGVTLLRLDRPCEALPHLQRSTTLDGRYLKDSTLQAEISRLKTVCGAKGSARDIPTLHSALP